MNDYNNNTFPLDQIELLEINRNGAILPRLRDLHYESTLKGSLLGVLYPGIRVAHVLVPTEPLSEIELVRVRNTMNKFLYKGIRYKLVGAASSAKDGLFYFVEEPYELVIAERFQRNPQDAITYFGILVSTCKELLDLPKARVLVVPDHKFGTNDCGGWIEETMALRLKLEMGSFSQFRLAVGHWQMKGSFKVMSKEVADLLGADFVIPESSVKPNLSDRDKVDHRIKTPIGHGFGFCNRVIVGIREVARPLEFDPSYTVSQFAGESFAKDIIPRTQKYVRDVNAAVAGEDYRRLLELIGHNPDSPATEVGTIEALLLADNFEGQIVKHPWVNAQLDKLLANALRKAFTAGAFSLPGSTLSHDGYLVAVNGKIYHGSDWIPRDQAISQLPSKRSLAVRFPVRMYDDLLPLLHMTTDDLVVRLWEELEKQGCPDAAGIAEHVVKTQLQLHGTVTQHSETAALNGGDFDFDLVGEIDEQEFPAWVRDRFAHQRTVSKAKDKQKKEKHGWWNIVFVALKAVGNQIGSITDLMTSCHANGRPDLADELVPELQKALDSLKWGVEPDRDKIKSIRQQVSTPPWLSLKHKRKVSDLPRHIDVKETDQIGILYNLVRADFKQFLTPPAKLETFTGLILGEPVTEDMLLECHRIHSAYGAVVASIAKRKAELKRIVEEAREKWEAVRNDPDKNVRKAAQAAKNQAQAAFYYNEERSKTEMNAMISYLKLWAQNKTHNRMAWAQAVNTIVCMAKPRFEPTGNASGASYTPTGSLMFITFPQEVVTRLAELNGRPDVRLFKRRMIEAWSRTDEYGRTYIIETTKEGLTETFLFTYRNGEITFDASIPSATKEMQASGIEAEQKETKRTNEKTQKETEEKKAQLQESKVAAQPAVIDDPEGLGHEIMDELMHQAEYGKESNANLETAPF